MSYYHPEMHPMLRLHRESPAHKLLTDPVVLPASGTVPPLTYHNGPTIKSPKLVALYAGRFWGDRAKNDQFLKELMEYGYLAPFSTQGTGNGQFLGSFNIPAPKSGVVTDADCQSMIQVAIAGGDGSKNGVPQPDANTLYMLILPDGVQSIFETGGNDASCKTYCAYHSNAPTFYYTVQPANTCGGCNQGNPQDGLQMTEAHEVVEACSDPSGQGWFNDQSGEENADECAWIALKYGPWVVQGAACVNSAGQWVNTVGTYTPVTTPQPVATTTSLAASPTSLNVGDSATLSASVTAADGSTPAGSIAFTAGGQRAGNGNAPTASASWTATDAGTVTLTATYSGDSTHSASTGSASVTVNAAPAPKPDNFRVFLDAFRAAVDWDDQEEPVDKPTAVRYFVQLATLADDWVEYLLAGGQ